MSQLKNPKIEEYQIQSILKIDNAKSDSYDVDIGTPQGTASGLSFCSISMICLTLVLTGMFLCILMIHCGCGWRSSRP